MKTFKDALWLTRFELKSTGIQQFVLLISLLGLTIYLIRSNIILADLQLNAGLDSMFIVTLILIPRFIRTKGFTMQKIAGDFYASPHLLHLQTLPISKRAIALYRFFIQLILSILVVTIVFVSIYDLVSNEVGIVHYLGSAVFWICFSTFIEHFISNGEAGLHLYNSLLWVISYALLAVILYFLIIFLWLPSGLVHWSFQLAHDNIVLLIAISMIFLLLTFFSIYRFTQKMKQTDYITSR